MAKYNLNVNGQKKTVDVLADAPLLWVLRDDLGLTATKYGCGVGECGACTVLLEGEAVRACQVTVAEVGDKKVVTLEGLPADGSHPLQKAWIENDVPQCGYCQSGQILSALALLKQKPHPTDDDINEAMDGNICRCGTYLRIRKAIHDAAKMGGIK